MSLAHNSSAPTVSLKAYLAYLIVSLYLFFEMAVQVSPSVMVDVLQRDLHVSLFALGIMSGAYFYTYTLMQVPVGLLFDRYSSRLIIATAILLCAAGCLVFSLSTHFYSATIARLLTGMGSAFAFVSVLVVSAQYFPRRYFPVMAGLGQMLAALGALSGQMPLNVLVTHYGWRHTMGLLCAIGLVLAVVVWVVLSGRAGQLQAQAAKRIEQATAAGRAAFTHLPAANCSGLLCFFTLGAHVRVCLPMGRVFLKSNLLPVCRHCLGHLLFDVVRFGASKPPFGRLVHPLPKPKDTARGDGRLGWLGIQCAVMEPDNKLVLGGALCFSQWCCLLWASADLHRHPRPGCCPWRNQDGH